MIMEAVKESLKDLETGPSPAEELSSSNKQPESLQDYDSQDSSMTEQRVPSNGSATKPTVTNEHGSASKLQVTDTNKMSAGPPNSILSAKVPENNGASADSHASVDNPSSASIPSADSDISVDNPSSASIDLIDHTKVTVTVIKNPTNNIMDGLLRRWDFTFFRNRS